MWMDAHPYISVYLIGSALSVILAVFTALLLWVLSWLTKSGVVARNLRKIATPPVSRGHEWTMFFVSLALEAMLSWIGVVIAIVAIPWHILKAVREALTSMPQGVQDLRYPLKSNPELSREAVWAYMRAFRVKIGEQPPDANGLLLELRRLLDHYPYFNREHALTHLRSLNAIDPAVVDLAISLQSKHDANYRDHGA